MITEKQVLAAMTYRGISEETIQIEEFTIEFWQDTDCESPYECDGMSPAIWRACDRFATPETYGELKSPLEYMSDGFISRNKSQIYAILADEFDTSIPEFEADLKECRKSDLRYTLQELRRDALQNMLDQIDKNSWSGFISYCETLASLYRFAGIPADTFQRNGCCQGDSVYGLIVMTPEWVESMGVPYANRGKFNSDKCREDMRGQADDYGAWCFGDCYGFTVSDDNGLSDSCGGFIGDNPKRNGMFDHLIPAMNYARNKAKADRIAKLKTLIRNRVQLGLRAELLCQ